MTGNVWEWTSDCFSDDPSRDGAPQLAPPERGMESAFHAGRQGRLAPVCAELLPPLPTGGAQGETIDTSTGHIGFRCVVRG